MSKNAGVFWTADGLGDKILNVPLSPYFTIVHYILITLTLRNRPGAKEYGSNHAFACLFVNVVSCFGGSIICNFLMGRSILHIFYINTTNVAIITFIWYNMYFAPFNFVHRLVSLKPVKGVLLMMKEVHRIRQINDGIHKVIALYPQSSTKEIFFVAVLIGSIRGSGAKFLMRPLDNFIRGAITADNEFLRFAFSTNHAVMSSILILLHIQGSIYTTFSALISYLTVFAALVQLATLLFNMRDPYSSVKDLLWGQRFHSSAESKKEKEE